MTYLIAPSHPTVSETLVQFRDSMRKVPGAPDLAFSVVEYSKALLYLGQGGENDRTQTTCARRHDKEGRFATTNYQ